MKRTIYITEAQKNKLKKAIAAQDQVGGKVNAGIMGAVTGMVCEEEGNGTETWYRGYDARFGDGNKDGSPKRWFTDDLEYAIEYAEEYGEYGRVGEYQIYVDRINSGDIQIGDGSEGTLDAWDGPSDEQMAEFLSQGVNGYDFMAGEYDSNCICIWDLSLVASKDREMTLEEAKQELDNGNMSEEKDYKIGFEPGGMEPYAHVVNEDLVYQHPATPHKEISDFKPNLQPLIMYKQFKLRLDKNGRNLAPGYVFPLYVNTEDGGRSGKASQGLKIGAWYKSGEGECWLDTENNRLYTKGKGYGTDGNTIQKLAYRPGWHLTTTPWGNQRGDNKVVGGPEGTGNNYLNTRNSEVWAKVEICVDIDATERARAMSATPADQCLQSLGDREYYKYRTNSNATDDQSWYIVDMIRIVDVLDDDTVDATNDKYYADLLAQNPHKKINSDPYNYTKDLKNDIPYWKMPRTNGKRYSRQDIEDMGYHAAEPTKIAVQEGRKKVIKNDEGKVVPEKCSKCGGEVVLQIHGEPVYVCKDCGEYYGTMPFPKNLKENREWCEKFDYAPYLKSLSKFLIDKGLEVKPLPKVILHKGEQEGLYIKTGYYDPDKKEVHLFVADRHPKDVLRSFVHEMIHHMQNLKDMLSGYKGTTLDGDDALQKLESEAYLKGNIYFRKWTEELHPIIGDKKQKLNESIQDIYNMQVEAPGFAAWFGNSKVVDKEGNPLPMYHGTNSEFTAFSKDYFSHGSDAYLGVGFNFTSSKYEASGYGENIHEVYLRAERPMTNRSKTISLGAVMSAIRDVDSGEDPDGTICTAMLSRRVVNPTPTDLYKAAKAIYDYAESDGDIYSAFGLAYSGSNDAKITEVFKSMGFDSCIDYDQYSGNITYVVVFDPNQIKSVNAPNFNPESDEMIDEAWNGEGEKFDSVYPPLESIPEKLYHVSPISNRDEILSQGLIPSVGNDYYDWWSYDGPNGEMDDDELPELVFLSSSPNMWLDLNGYGGYDLYEIDTAKLDKESITLDPTSNIAERGGYCYDKTIPPSAIKLIRTYADDAEDDVIYEDTNPEDVDLSSFELKDELNPRFWKNGKLDSRVRVRLLDIADDFIDTLNVGWVSPKDIIMTGSLANYNWSKEHSDIDLHIVMDFTDVDENVALVKEYFDSKKRIWNEEHDNLTIGGYPVEVYVQDMHEEHASSGVYSLENDKWIVKPSIKNFEGNIDDKTIKEKAAEYMNEIDELIDEYEDKVAEVDLSKLHEKAVELFKRIKAERKNGFEQGGGEFNTGNLIFKTLRRNGYIGKLSKLKLDTYDSMQSLLNEGVVSDKEYHYITLGHLNDVICDNKIRMSTAEEADVKDGMKYLSLTRSRSNQHGFPYGTYTKNVYKFRNNYARIEFDGAALNNIRNVKIKPFDYTYNNSQDGWFGDGDEGLNGKMYHRQQYDDWVYNGDEWYSDEENMGDVNNPQGINRQFYSQSEDRLYAPADYIENAFKYINRIDVMIRDEYGKDYAAFEALLSEYPAWSQKIHIYKDNNSFNKQV